MGFNAIKSRLLYYPYIVWVWLLFSWLLLTTARSGCDISFITIGIWNMHMVSVDIGEDHSTGCQNRLNYPSHFPEHYCDILWPIDPNEQHSINSIYQYRGTLELINIIVDSKESLISKYQICQQEKINVLHVLKWVYLIMQGKTIYLRAPHSDIKSSVYLEHPFKSFQLVPTKGLDKQRREIRWQNSKKIVKIMPDTTSTHLKQVK